MGISARLRNVHGGAAAIGGAKVQQVALREVGQQPQQRPQLPPPLRGLLPLQAARRLRARRGQTLRGGDAERGCCRLLARTLVTQKGTLMWHL